MKIHSVNRLFQYARYLVLFILFFNSCTNIQNEAQVSSQVSKNHPSTKKDLSIAQNSSSYKQENVAGSLQASILEQVTLRLREEKGLIPVGLITVIFNEDRKIHEAFRYFNDINIETGRELIIYIINNFLKTYNENKQIQLYLNHPCFIDNIEIEIYKENGNEEYSSLPKTNELAVISFRNGKLIYETYDSITAKLHRIYEETYQEEIER